MLSPQGQDFLFDDCGRAFTCLPVEEHQAPVEAVVCNLDCLLDIMSHRVRGLAWEPHFPTSSAEDADLEEGFRKNGLMVF